MKYNYRLEPSRCKYSAVSLMLAAHRATGPLGEIVGLRRYYLPNAGTQSISWYRNRHVLP